MRTSARQSHNDHLPSLLSSAWPLAVGVAANTARELFGQAAPDRARALAEYRRMAPGYEIRTMSGDRWRHELVARLAPRRGETILDVGCGTGRNFQQIQHGVGPAGRLIGIEPSSEMLAQALARVRSRGWTNVELILAGAEEAVIPMPADGVLLCAVHDVMRARVALENLLGHLRDGGRIVAGGPKWVPLQRPGAVSRNLLTWQLNRHFVSTFEGFGQPWSVLAEIVPGLLVEELCFGSGYAAWGKLSRHIPGNAETHTEAAPS
jgi:SAM-dependent methyltransferase